MGVGVGVGVGGVVRNECWYMATYLQCSTIPIPNPQSQDAVDDYYYPGTALLPLLKSPPPSSPPPAPCCLVHPACMHSCTALAGPLRPLSQVQSPSVPTARTHVPVLGRAQGPRSTEDLSPERASEGASNETHLDLDWAAARFHCLAQGCRQRSAFRCSGTACVAQDHGSMAVSSQQVERRPADFDRAFASLPSLFLHGTSHTVPASHPAMTPLAALPSTASLLRLCGR